MNVRLCVPARNKEKNTVSCPSGGVLGGGELPRRQKREGSVPSDA